MKIAISGSQGTGKSTLIKAIEDANLLPDYTFIKEIVRSLREQGVKINREADHISQCKILEEHYKNHFRYFHFLTDRCAVDAYVYALYDYLHGKYTFEEHKQHEALFLSSMGFYNLFFYLPIEFKLTNDGIRDMDIQYQKDIDNLFRIVYTRHRIPYQILSGNVKTRLTSFLQIVREYKH
jgi:nicotinamide riboside kinase